MIRIMLAKCYVALPSKGIQKGLALSTMGELFLKEDYNLYMAYYN
jgi:hypothetical protein